MIIITKMWMVRAGEKGFLIDRFEKENAVLTLKNP